MKNQSGTLRFPKIPVIILSALAALFLIVAIVADIVINSYWEIIAAAFSDTESVTNQNLMDEAIEESHAVNVELLEEGSVLLKNDDNVLPIPSSTKKLNVYGIISANIYLNTSGSGSVNNDNVTSLKTALEGEGYEINSALWNLLKAQKVEGNNPGINEGSTIEDAVSEIRLAQYNSAMTWENAKTYSEYAIVTFGRAGAEGSDLSRGSATKTSMLELGSSEIALLKQLHDTGFNVVTLINSSHVIELGPVIQYSDAILWIGGPGLYGLEGVAHVLSGKVSPSGRLVDTWMYEQETSSTYYTAQQYNYSGASGGYTNYNEGIYIGYKWYETADAEGYWDKAPYSGYDNVVAYPFGYGLSYGELTEEIIDIKHENGAFTFTVKATNATGASATKDVFELYVEKPYTNGGVEVSKIELVAFAKSDIITSGGSYSTTITVKDEDLASYDSTAANGAGAYVLAGGEYKFYIASGKAGAHCWKTANESNSKTYTLTEVVYSGNNGRSSDAVAAQNQLGADQNDNALAIDDSNSGYKALSRANNFANASSTIGRSAVANNIAASEKVKKLLTDYTDYGKYHGEILSNLKTEQKKKYSFADLYTTDADGKALYEAVFDESTGELVGKNITGSVDYDDARWDYLISQMSVDDMQKLIGQGGWMTAKVDSIDKIKGVDYDGPSGLSNLMQNSLGIKTQCTSFNSEPVTASTWNVELADKLGKAVAKEANASGQSGWYAPGANIHRTPFGGRNAEYFSEDAYISGMMCAAESGGALSLGLYCMAKHFAFNDIEANRTSLENCYMSEQTAREIYLKAFEIGVKSGDVPGLMCSYMWINGEWLGGDYALLTKIVRDEWGFKGLITTDNAGQGGGYKWMSPAKMIYAGGDMVLANPAQKLPNEIKNSDEGISAMKTASKHILYTIASAYLNRLEAARVGENKFEPIFVVINVILYVVVGHLVIADGVLLIVYSVRKKKSANVGGDDLQAAEPDVAPSVDSPQADETVAEQPNIELNE